MSQNRYEVLGKIADGGLGSVFKAYDRNLRREVALKRVRAESQEEADRQAEQLFEEARTISTLQHPHIVTVFDVGKDDEGAFIVMELLKGETLEDIIQRGALNETDFRELVTQSLEGMIAAHASGLIHLDIKPQNFMVIWLPSGKFQIKILDFGLAKLAQHPQVQDMSDDGAIMGSIFFMAPEQFERSPVDVRTDLYSLGCVYYFALTQHYPFQGETGPEVMASHMYHSMIPLAQLRPDLPDWACRWVEWLLSRDPNARPVTAAQAHEWFAAGQVPALEPASGFFDDGTVAMALLDDEQIPSAEPDDASPAPIPSGSTSQLLRPTAPKITRPVPGRPTGAARPAPKPVLRPVNIATAAAPKHLQHREPLPQWLTLWVPIGLAAVVVIFFAFKFAGRRMAEGRFETLAKMESPLGTEKDVRLLLKFLEEKDNSEVAGRVLAKLGGVPNANSLLAAQIPLAKAVWARKNLTMALGARGAENAAEALLAQLDQVSAAEIKLATWQALARIAGAGDVSSMLSKLPADNMDILRAAEGAVINATRQEPDLKRRGREVLQAYLANSGTDEVRASLLRMLGKLGNPEGLAPLTKALQHPSALLRNAAALSLADWPSGEPIGALLEFIANSKDAYIRRNAFNSLGALAPLAGEKPQDELATALIEAYGKTRDNQEQIAILNALTRVSDPAALAFFQELSTKETRRKPIADPATKSLGAALAKATSVGESTVLPSEMADRSPGPLLVDKASGAIINWFGLSDHVNWLVKLEQPGEYEVELSQAYAGQKPGGYAVTFGSGFFPKNIEVTGSASSYRSVSVGRTRFAKPGHYRVWVRPLVIAPGDQLMRMKDVTVRRTAN
ncbi:MAG: protein kinase domain-containing protein [Roseimicrobium sp.]